MTAPIKILQERADFIANFINDQTPTKLRNELNEINEAIKILSQKDAELPRPTVSVHQTWRGGIHLETNTNDKHDH